MWFDLRKEDLVFRERAPVVHVAELDVALPRSVVFGALADALSWPQWFPGVRAASYVGEPPYGVGTIRHADVNGTRWVEEMIAWDEPTCWAWTVTRSTVPFSTAQVESFELGDAGGATHLRWALASEPRLLGRLAAPFVGSSMRRLLGRAMANLACRA